MVPPLRRKMETRTPTVLAGLGHREVSLPHSGLRLILIFHFEMKHAGLKREGKTSKILFLATWPLESETRKVLTRRQGWSPHQPHYLGKCPRTFEGHLSKRGPVRERGLGAPSCPFGAPLTARKRLWRSLPHFRPLSPISDSAKCRLVIQDKCDTYL